jgi:hypothetical protein
MEDIHVIHQENGGKPAALNAALQVVKGEAVLVLDDDDLILPGAVNVLAHGLFSNPALVAVFGDAIVFSTQSETKGYWPALRSPGPLMSAAVLHQIPAATGATLVRMSAQRKAGDYDVRLRRCEDMDMFLRLSQLGPMEALPLPTFLLRDHAGLRGAKGEQFSKADPAVGRATTLSYSKPVFLERWKAFASDATRQEGHAWALGLWERELFEEAKEEVGRWSGPYSKSEIWIRSRLGLMSEAASPREALLVVDDGDEGALEACLHRYSDNRSIFVDLEVPRDPFGRIRLQWDGHYVVRQRLNSDWVDHAGPVVLRVSSDPGWAPPPLENLSLLPDLPAPEAVRAYSHIVGWPEPSPIRVGLPTPSTPLLGALRACRAHTDVGNHLRAISALREVLALQPNWLGAWWLAAEVFERAGLAERADSFRQRLVRLAS